MLVLRRGENRSSRRKTSRSRIENQQTQPTYDAWSGNRTRDTLVEGERSHHYTNPALNLTSDMNGSNSNLSSLLCSRGNVSCSKEPKYTSKSSSTHPYRRTYALSKQFQEIECQSNALFDEISEHTRLVRHARTTCLLDAWLSRTRKCFFQRKFSAGFANKLRNQFRGLGQSQALLRLRYVFCCSFRDLFDWKTWFLRLTRNSSSTTRKL